MEPKIIKTAAEYEAALVHLHKLMHARPGTPKGDRLELWAKQFDRPPAASRHHPIAFSIS